MEIATGCPEDHTTRGARPRGACVSCGAATPCALGVYHTERVFNTISAVLYSRCVTLNPRPRHPAMRPDYYYVYTPNEITDCCVSYRRSKKYISSSIRTEHTIFGRNGWQEEQSCTSTDCKNEMKISLFMPVSLNPQWLVCKYHSAFGKDFVMFSIAPTGE